METVSLSVLRSHLVEYLEKAARGQKIIVTSHGRTLAYIIPPDISREDAKKRLEELREKAIVGDIVSPIGTQWEADS
jgi:prevent-host-death family protein